MAKRDQLEKFRQIMREKGYDDDVVNEALSGVQVDEEPGAFARAGESFVRGFHEAPNIEGSSFLERRAHDVGNYGLPAMGGVAGAPLGPLGAAGGAMGGRVLQKSFSRFLDAVSETHLAPEFQGMKEVTDIGAQGAGEVVAGKIINPAVGYAWTHAKKGTEKRATAWGSRFTGKPSQTFKTFISNPIGALKKSSGNYRQEYVEGITPTPDSAAVEGLQAKLNEVRALGEGVAPELEEQAAHALATAEHPAPLLQLEDSLALRHGRPAVDADYEDAITRAYQGFELGMTPQDALDGIQAINQVMGSVPQAKQRFYMKLQERLKGFLMTHNVPGINKAMEAYKLGTTGDAMSTFLPDKATAPLASALSGLAATAAGVSTRSPYAAAGAAVGTMAAASPAMWSLGIMGTQGTSKLAEFLTRRAVKPFGGAAIGDRVIDRR